MIKLWGDRIEWHDPISQTLKGSLPLSTTTSVEIHSNRVHVESGGRELILYAMSDATDMVAWFYSISELIEQHRRPSVLQVVTRYRSCLLREAT